MARLYGKTLHIRTRKCLVERIRFSSMAYFILMLVTLTIGGLLFGKADTMRSILKEVGLDLSESTYIKQKQREYKKRMYQGVRKCNKIL